VPCGKTYKGLAFLGLNWGDGGGGPRPPIFKENTGQNKNIGRTKQFFFLSAVIIRSFRILASLTKIQKVINWGPQKYKKPFSVSVYSVLPNFLGKEALKKKKKKKKQKKKKKKKKKNKKGTWGVGPGRDF